MTMAFATLIVGTTERRFELLIALTGWTIIIAGTLGLFAALYERSRAARSIGWPTTRGEVVVSRASKVGNPTSLLPAYHEYVQYQYSVSGRTYRSSKAGAHGGFYAGRKRCNQLTNRYPVGRHITVYYDPKHPERAVLEPGVGGNSWFWVATAVLMLAVGVCLVVFSGQTGNRSGLIRRHRQSRAQNRVLNSLLRFSPAANHTRSMRT